MANLKFPGPLQSRARSTSTAPVTSIQQQVDAQYPGAMRQSDAGTLANVPARSAYPGSGMPREPWEPAEKIRPLRIRRDA